MAKKTSYICEHSAEFALVPALKKVLNQKFKFVTPVFPWITREGSNISFQLHGHEKFRVLGLYPRRPKIHSTDYEKITVKVNEQVLFGSKAGLDFGIPIIAGCPVASNFWELGKDPENLWIKLEQDSMESFEIDFHINESKELTTKYPDYFFQSDEELISFIINKSELIDLGQTLDAIKKIKMLSKGIQYYYSMAFMGGYKPVYFLIK